MHTERMCFPSQGVGDQGPLRALLQYTHRCWQALARLPSDQGIRALTGVPWDSQAGMSSPCLNLDRQDGALAGWGFKGPLLLR